MSNSPVAVSRTANDGELIQLVSFNLDQEEYGVEVLKVREIIRMPTITHIPNTPQYVEGIINLRGKIIPVVSMRKKFGFQATQDNSHTRIIIMDFAGKLMGYIVDAVSEVIRISGAEIQPPPSVVSGCVDQEFIAGVINLSERLLIFLDLDKLFPADDRSYLDLSPTSSCMS